MFFMHRCLTRASQQLLRGSALSLEWQGHGTTESGQGSEFPGPAQHQGQMRLLRAVLPWNPPEQSWHSHHGQPTPLPPWILFLIRHLNLSGWCPLCLWLSLFHHLPPCGTRGCCQHLQSQLLLDSTSLMGELLQPWPSCFWYSRKWLLPWRRVHLILQGNRKGELHWHIPQHHLTPCDHGTAILSPSPALQQAGLQLNQCLLFPLQVVSVGASHPSSGSGNTIADLCPAPQFLGGFILRAVYKANPQNFYSYK